MRSFLIIAAGVVLLGLGVVLWRMTQDTSEVAAAPSEKRTPPPHAAAPAPEAAPVAARDAHISVAPPVRPQARQAPAPTVAAPELAAPAPDKDTDPPSRKDLKQQFKKQLDAIDGYVTDCVNRAAKTGSKPKGAANLIIRAQRVKNKVVVSEVAVEPLDTTIKDPADQPLLDCLASTGKHVQLDFPEEVNHIYATHQVELDSGAVTDHKLTALYLNPEP